MNLWEEISISDRVGLFSYVPDYLPEVEGESVGSVGSIALNDGIESGMFEAVEEATPCAGLELAVWDPRSEGRGGSRKDDGAREDSTHGERRRRGGKGED